MDTRACPCFVCYSPLGMCAQINSFAGNFILVVAKEVGNGRSGRGDACGGASSDRLMGTAVKLEPTVLWKGAQIALCARAIAPGAAGPPRTVSGPSACMLRACPDVIRWHDS